MGVKKNTWNMKEKRTVSGKSTRVRGASGTAREKGEYELTHFLKMP